VVVIVSLKDLFCYDTVLVCGFIKAFTGIRRDRNFPAGTYIGICKKYPASSISEEWGGYGSPLALHGQNSKIKIHYTQPSIALPKFLILSRIDANKCPKVDFEARNTHEKSRRNGRYVNNLPYLAVFGGVHFAEY
jgi:hypothetical protein